MDVKMHLFISNLQYVTDFVGANHGGCNSHGQMVGNRG